MGDLARSIGVCTQSIRRLTQVRKRTNVVNAERDARGRAANPRTSASNAMRAGRAPTAPGPDLRDTVPRWQLNCQGPLSSRYHDLASITESCEAACALVLALCLCRPWWQLRTLLSLTAPRRRRAGSERRPSEPTLAPWTRSSCWTGPSALCSAQACKGSQGSPWGLIRRELSLEALACPIASLARRQHTTPHHQLDHHLWMSARPPLARQPPHTPLDREGMGGMGIRHGMGTGINKVTRPSGSPVDYVSHFESGHRSSCP